MARPLLADPHFLLKAGNQIPEAINTCIACNQACLDHAFVGKTASCLVNPKACHEIELISTPLPEDERCTIGVIGAGPAGCAFAIAAAERGHQVTLYDQGDKIGGQFHMAKRIPGKEEFHETLRYFEYQLKAMGVTVQLNTTISHDTMAQAGQSVDKWIVATGVTPRNPKIPGGDHPNVVSYIDVLKHNHPIGERVAVIGAGGIGFDVAEFLLYHDRDKRHDEVSIPKFWHEWGIDPEQKERGGMVSSTSQQQQQHQANPKRQVYLMQRKKGKVGAGLGRTTGWIHRATLKMGGVKDISGVSYDRIDEKGHLHYTTKDGKKEVLEVDNIILCAGQIEYDELEKDAQKDDDLKSKVYTIGGAYMAGELDAKRAIDMGTRLALKIHEKDVTPGNHVFQSPPGVEEKMFNFLKRFR